MRGYSVYDTVGLYINPGTFGIVIMTNGKRGQQVYQGILGEIMGGKYPDLDWLKNL